MDVNDWIEFAFKELKRMRLVGNRTEFVRHWLGREESYLRVLRHKRRQASADAIDNCRKRIAMYANRFVQSPHRRLRQIGGELGLLRRQLDYERHRSPQRDMGKSLINII